MSTSDFPGVRWRGHWVVADVLEFVIDPTSVGSAEREAVPADGTSSVDPYGAMLPRDIGILGGPRVVAPSVVVQNAPAIPDLWSLRILGLQPLLAAVRGPATKPWTTSKRSWSSSALKRDTPQRPLK